jgi:hypothetical protein
MPAYTGYRRQAQAAIRIVLWQLYTRVLTRALIYNILYKEIQRDPVQSLAASSYMGRNLRISSYIRKPFLIYDFAPDPI